jgi:transcriptional regulator with XRE-family HTH domain
LRWSQAELAKAAGLTRNAVRYWEQAKVIPYGDDKTPAAVRWIEETLMTAGVRTVVFPFAGVYLIPGKPPVSELGMHNSKGPDHG